MNALLQAQQAYAPTKSVIRTGQETEIQLLQTTTAELRQAATGLPSSFPKLAEALHQNRRVWTHLAASVADHDNALPKDLRARIVYLSEFVDHHSRRVRQGKADIRPLVEINAAVMRGLNHQGAK